MMGNERSTKATLTNAQLFSSLLILLFIVIYDPLTDKSTAQFIIFEPNFVSMI